MKTTQCVWNSALWSVCAQGLLKDTWLPSLVDQIQPFTQSRNQGRVKCLQDEETHKQNCLFSAVHCWNQVAQFGIEK
jgi:hypothetical protein